MKKILLTTALGLIAAVSSYGQGAITFANATSSYGTATPDHLVRWDASAAQFNAGLVAGGLVASNSGGVNLTGLRAQLYYGSSTVTSLAGMIAVTDAPATWRASTSLNAGSWLGGGRTLVGFDPGQTVTLAILVWDSSVQADARLAAAGVGTTYAGVFGSSGFFNYNIPTGNPAPSAFLPGNSPFTVGFTPVPEPTTMALAGLGAAALMIFRRRK